MLNHSRFPDGRAHGFAAPLRVALPPSVATAHRADASLRACRGLGQSPKALCRSIFCERCERPKGARNAALPIIREGWRAEGPQPQSSQRALAAPTARFAVRLRVALRFAQQPTGLTLPFGAPSGRFGPSAQVSRLLNHSRFPNGRAHGFAALANIGVLRAGRAQPLYLLTPAGRFAAFGGNSPPG